MALKPISNDSKLKYLDLLNFSARKRYLENLKIRGQVLSDPYSMSETCWCDDMTNWPELLFSDVYTYLINTKGLFTKQKMESLQIIRSLQLFL